jgi:parvulin-like peptidyl-prolyl isomerase
MTSTRRHPRRVSLGSGLVLTFAIGATLLAGCGRAVVKDAVVARVNGEAVHRSRVDTALAVARLSQKNVTASDALNGVIDDVLMQQEAHRLGVAAAQKAVDERESALASQVGGDAALEQSLKSAGLTRTQLRQTLALVLLGERLADVKFPAVTVPRDQIESFYRAHLDSFRLPADVKLGEIVVPTERLAQAAIARIKGGQSFYVTARQFSRDQEGKALGGQMGWVLTDSLPTPLAKAVAGLRTGRLSGPVKSLGGFYVLMVYGKRPARTAPLSAVSNEIREFLLRQRRDAALKTWLAQARRRARIEIVH